MKRKLLAAVALTLATLSVGAAAADAGILFPDPCRSHDLLGRCIPHTGPFGSPLP